MNELIKINNFCARLEQKADDNWFEQWRLPEREGAEGYSGRDKIYCNMKKAVPFLTKYFYNFFNEILKKPIFKNQIKNFLEYYIPNKKCWYYISCFRYNNRIDWSIYKENSCESIGDIILSLVLAKEKENKYTKTII